MTGNSRADKGLCGLIETWGIKEKERERSRRCTVGVGEKIKKRERRRRWRVGSRCVSLEGQKICSVWEHAHRFDQIGPSRGYQAKRTKPERKK
jgi:hypothetical protein